MSSLIRVRYFLCISILLLISTCANQNVTSDKAFTLKRAELLTIFDSKQSYTLAVEKKNDITKYLVLLDFIKTDYLQHWFCVIWITPEGQLFEEKAAGSGTQLSTALTELGLRHYRQITGFGPGGASEELVFTTADKRYDVKVMISNLLPLSVEIPKEDVASIALQINSLYVNRQE